MEQVYQDEKLELPLHQPLWKFTLLNLCSGGLYLVYWQYKSWSHIQQREQRDISPIWRAIFSILFTISLNKKIAALAGEKKGKSFEKYGVLAGIGFILISILSRLPDPFWVLYLLAFVPLLPVVKYQNIYISEEYPNTPLRKNLTRWETAIIIIGGLLITFTILSLVFPIPEEQY